MRQRLVDLGVQRPTHLASFCDVVVSPLAPVLIERRRFDVSGGVGTSHQGAIDWKEAPSHRCLDRTTRAEDSGTSFQAPGRSPAVAETTRPSLLAQAVQDFNLRVATQCRNAGGKVQRPLLPSLEYRNAREIVSPSLVATVPWNGCSTRDHGQPSRPVLWRARQRRTDLQSRLKVRYQEDKVSESVDLWIAKCRTVTDPPPSTGLA